MTATYSTMCVMGSYSETTIERGLAANEGGLRLKAAREAAGLTQAGLAKALGWGQEAQNRVSQYERGERQISAEIAVELGRHFQVPAVWFTGLVSKKEAQLLSVEGGLSGPITEPRTPKAETLTGDTSDRSTERRHGKR